MKLRLICLFVLCFLLGPTYSADFNKKVDGDNQKKKQIEVYDDATLQKKEKEVAPALGLEDDDDEELDTSDGSSL